MIKILTIGNALVDEIYQVSEEFLAQAGLPKGSMTLVDAPAQRRIREQLKNMKPRRASGGSAANTARGLAHLGIPCGFIGKVGQDETGEFFLSDMKQTGVVPHLGAGTLDSGVALTLMTPDSERTFATYLGSAVQMSAEELDADLIAGFDLIHIEGYLVQDHELFESILEIAADEGLMISLDLASYNVVEANAAFLRDILPGNVDLLFANDMEARAFTGLDPLPALRRMGEDFLQVIVKTGPQGSLVAESGRQWTIPAMKADVIDTNGAGDLFAAGYLAGWAHGRSPEECAILGTHCAARVIEVTGTTLPTQAWERIRQDAASLLKAPQA